MLQEALALLTVAGAVFFAVRGLYKSIFVKPSQGGGMCSGCAAGSCPAKLSKVNSK